jgi:hypothetical protein
MFKWLFLGRYVQLKHCLFNLCKNAESFCRLNFSKFTMKIYKSK